MESMSIKSDPALEQSADEASRHEKMQKIMRENEGIALAMEILKEVSADEQLSTAIRIQEKADRDWQARLNYAVRESEARGERKSQLEIAKNLLDILDDETIAIKTGLTPKDVAALRNAQPNS